MSFINKEGKPDGFYVEMMNQIATRENFSIQWEYDSWSNILAKVKSQEIDMVSSIVYSKKRALDLEFSNNSLVIGWLQIYLPFNSKIETFLDLENKTVVGMKGSSHIVALKNRCAKFEINCTVVETENYKKAFELLGNGKVDAAIMANSVGNWYLSDYEVMASSIIFNPIKGYVAIPKGENKWLLETFDSYMFEWKKNKNSVYHIGKQKWMAAKYTKGYSQNLWYYIVGLSTFGLLALLTVIRFKRRIMRRTYEISVRNEQFSQIINLVPHMIYVADENGNILLANKKASEYFGMSGDEIERCSIENYKKHHHKGKRFLNDNDLSQFSGSTEINEISTKDFRGNQYTLLLSKVPFSGMKRNNTFVTVAVDITEIKEYEKKVTSLAHYNQVTGLPNKSLFKMKLEESLKAFKVHKKYGALLYIDLDEFKKINDTHGYKIGDLLLKKMVKRLEANLKNLKTFAHLGGDEFVIDLPEQDQEPVVTEVLAVQFTELVQAMISKPIPIDDSLFQITACVGIALYPRDGKTEESLMQRVGTALNEAKNAGTNNFKLFDKALESKVKSDHILETELRQALDKNQFILHYQPITNRNKAVIGAEALVRWNHPSKGLTSPGEFIAIAEKLHLIVRIGDWILEQACKKIQENIIEGRRDFFIAVNVSVLQIKNKFFYKRVLELIDKYSIPPNSIELEITESVLMEDIGLSIVLFNKLKLLGVKISIDDFGTGYSSFSYLMKLPIDKIKIDQSFVKVLPEDNNSATIVRTIIKMAKELGMKIVAEGIETEEQYQFLAQEGCQYFQGFYLHRPMEYTKAVNLNSIKSI